MNLKKNILFLLFQFITITVTVGISQNTLKEWEPIDFSKERWSSEDNISILSQTQNATYFCFSNVEATSKENKKKGDYQPMYAHFSINKEEFTHRPFFFQVDIKNEHNNPIKYHYYVYERKKNGALKKVKHKSYINWGFLLQFEDESGKRVYYTETYAQSPDGTYYLSVNGEGWVTTSSSRITNRLNVFKGADNLLIIKGGELGETELCQLEKIRDIKSLSLMVGPAARVVAENMEGIYLTDYGFIKSLYHVMEKALDREDYKNAIKISTVLLEEFKYATPDLYYNRAYAHYYLAYYVSAIEDCTKGLALDPLNTDFYLLRAFSKWKKEDDSFLEDLKRGGPEGESLYKEIMWELENNSTSGNKGKQPKKRAPSYYKPLRKDPNFKLN